MRKPILFCLALVGMTWSHGQALACQTSRPLDWDEETAQREAKLEWDRLRAAADIVVVGAWAPDDNCIDAWGQQCSAHLTVSEVRRGNPSRELDVGFKVPETMCDFFEPLRNVRGVFYLNRVENAEAYSVVDFELIETPDS